jgi:RimJ/RimL family protein N-acetyltransferase
MLTRKEDIHFRFANEQDVDLYYEWANDDLVRNNSFNAAKIPYQAHLNWFKKKVKEIDCRLYLFLDKKNTPIGQVRIDKNGQESIIGISIGVKFRGKSLAAELLKQSTNDYLNMNRNDIITAYIKIENENSLKVFESAGFCEKESVLVQNHKSYKLKKRYKPE